MKTKRFLICIVALVGCIWISCKHSSSNTPPLDPLEPQVTIKADKEGIDATSVDRTVTLTATVDNYNSEETEITYQWYEMSSVDDNEGGEPIAGKTAASCTIVYDETKTGTFYYYCIATVSSTSGKSNVLTISVSKKNNITPPPTEPTKYTITTNTPNATIKGLETEYEASSTVTFTVTPNDDYEITSVKMDDESLAAEKDGSYSFIMPEKNVVITVSVSKKHNITPPPTEATKYAVTTNTPNATIKGLETEYEASSTVTFIVTPNKGYEITSVKMDDKSLVAEKDGSYSFIMPEKNVEITVVATKEFGGLDVIVQ